MVAGSGEGTAANAGTPAACSSGVAMADPPLPNIPPRNPTAAPMIVVLSALATSTIPVNGLRDSPSKTICCSGS
jgi:hypothetical protein